MLDSIACRRCGQLGDHVEVDARPTHWRKLVCGGCTAYIKFLPRPGGQKWPKDPSEWTWAHPARVRMRDLPATDAQLEVLKNAPEPWCWVRPVSRDDAHMVIGHLRAEGVGA